MNRPSYEVAVSKNRLRYEFISIGAKGHIQKIVEYSYVNSLNVWNLGFGDFDPATGRISDSVISDNGDGRKVITTVALTLLQFFEVHPTETVIFTGSDTRRTMLYNRIVLQFYDEFSDRLLITGLNQEGIEVDIETGIQYAAFIIYKVS
ncbi:DUF6934 family protein [Spirosoma endophyticum]|uniref:Uncharacterized protein n=1 Tax=Spirosoma endophyticum TaxID=662367 RepID=A0A1I2A3M2_9BACT|nr:hypothetical protein [Spirosoma endophyticum]SFE38744.1 hypothetical protein SAMN05216167_11373 [Spirosoma endophyticum]